MPHIKIGRFAINCMEAPISGQVLYFDTQPRGLGIRVGRISKTFFVERRVNDKTRRVTIRRYGVFTCEQARKEALRLLGAMAMGSDPNAEKVRPMVRGVTLEESFEESPRFRDLAERTVCIYARAMKIAFVDWLPRPMVDIHGEMVLKRFKELTNKRGPGYANLAMRCLRSVRNFARGRYTDVTGRSLISVSPVGRLSETRVWNKLRRRQTVIKRHQLAEWDAAVIGLRSDKWPEKAEVVRDYLLFLLFTGLKRQEAAGIKWSNVDFWERTFKISDTKNREPLTLPMSSFRFDLPSDRRCTKTTLFSPALGRVAASSIPASFSLRPGTYPAFDSRTTTFDVPSSPSPRAWISRAMP